MLYKLAHYNDLQRYLKSTSLTRRMIGGILHTFHTWVESTGPEATIDRLKALKVYALTGEVPPTTSWVGLRRDGRPKGHFGCLWRRENVSMETCLQVLTVLYSSITATAVSDRQLDKFLSNAGKKAKWPDLVDQSILNNWFSPHFEVDVLQPLDFRLRTIKALDKARFDHFDKWICSPIKRAPIVNLSIFSSTIEAGVSWNEHTRVVESSWFNPFFPVKPDGNVYTLPSQYYEATPYNGPSREVYYPPLPIVGVVSVIQERGMKARFIANPLRVHQAALSRLMNYAFGLCSLFDWDCTYDQLKGVRFVTESLRAGKVVYSIDLTSATDNMPLHLTTAMMRALIKVSRASVPSVVRQLFDKLLEDISLFEILARGRWILPAAIKDRAKPYLDSDGFFRWTVGQPLGLGPSFALFAITHGLILRYCESKFTTRNTFRILGDDVVINDHRVARVYRELLKNLDCPISEEKCLTSSKMAEFAGKIITLDGPLDVQKWKLSGGINFLRWLGYNGIPFMPPSLRKFAKIFLELPEPLGLGLNREGRPLSCRMGEDFIEEYSMASSPYRIIPSNGIDYRRRVESEAAFAEGNDALLYQDVRYSRPDRSDPVESEHYSSLVRDYWGHFLPEKVRKSVEDFLSKYNPQFSDSPRGSPFSEKESDPRFYRLYRIYRRGLRQR